jgi:hypothetical protein
MRAIVVVIALAAGAAVQADILHLRDGSRYHGTLISQNERAVVFRVTLADGSSGALRSFPRSLVKRVERTTRATPSESDRPVEEPPATMPAEDFEQMLREAFELLDDGDSPAALRAMQRIAARAPEEHLADMDRRTRSARGLGLARLMAETRLRVALGRGRGGAFRLKFVTRYEASAMGRLLEELQGEFLAKSHEGRTVAAWAAERYAYTELHATAREMVADARLAAAMIGARLKFDPRLRKSGEHRRQLAALHDDVVRFVAQVISMRGYTSLGMDDDDMPEPVAREVARLMALQAAASQPSTQPSQEPQPVGDRKPPQEEEHP